MIITDYKIIINSNLLKILIMLKHNFYIIFIKHIIYSLYFFIFNMNVILFSILLLAIFKR